MNSVAASSASYSLHTAEPNIERSRHTPGEERALPTNIHSSLGVLTAHACPLHLPFFLSFFFFSPLRRRQPLRKWRMVISSHGTRLTHRTFKLCFLFFFFCLLQSRQGKDVPCHPVRRRPSTYSPPTTNILSAHAHGKGLGTTQRTGNQWRAGATQTPHTPGALPLRTWLFSPSKDLPSRSWRRPGRVQNGFGWNTHPPSAAVSAWKPF